MFDPFHARILQVLGNCYAEEFAAAPFAADLTPLGFVQTDVIFGPNPGGQRIPQGCVALDPKKTGCPLVSIAGTKTPGQWFLDFLAMIKDSDFCPGSQTETGFTDFYHGLTLGSGMGLREAFSSVPGVTVQGHSLGGPAATMLAGDCKADELVCFASPKPGNAAFARWVRAQVSKITLYANAPDVVPHSPLTLEPIEDYEPVDTVTALNSRGLTRHNLGCYHHWSTYLHLIAPGFGLSPDCTLIP